MAVVVDEARVVVVVATVVVTAEVIGGLPVVTVVATVVGAGVTPPFFGITTPLSSLAMTLISG